MTKREFINMILTTINGGSFHQDVFKKVHPKVLESYIELGLNDIMFNIFKDTRNYELYAKWYESIPIKKYIMGLYSCEYPSALMQTVTKSNSVIRIVPTEEFDSTMFMPSTATEAAQISRLGTGGRNSVVPYVTLKEHIEFYNHNKNISEVNILAFKPINEYNSSDDLPIPAGSGEALLQFVLKYAISQTPDKLSTDQNPDT